MCCNTTMTHAPNKMMMGGHHPFGIQCGCGCLGRDKSTTELDRYREHLKAELKHVETRISQLDGEASS